MPKSLHLTSAQVPAELPNATKVGSPSPIWDTRHQSPRRRVELLLLDPTPWKRLSRRDTRAGRAAYAWR